MVGIPLVTGSEGGNYWTVMFSPGFNTALCGCHTLSIYLRNCRGGSKGVIAFQRSLGVQLTPNKMSICMTERALLHSATKKASTSALSESRPDIRHSLTRACSIFALHKDYD